MTISATKICEGLIGLLPDNSTGGFLHVIATKHRKNLVDFAVDARSIEPVEERVDVPPNVLEVISKPLNA